MKIQIQMRMGWMMLVFVALVAGQAGGADFLVGSGQTYSTIQAAVDAARTNGGAGTHTVRIMDSANYAESVKLDNAGFTNINLTIEAASGQTPKLHSFRTTSVAGNITMPGLTLRRLHFDESLLGAQTPALLGAAEIGLSARFTGNVIIESCTFTSTATTSWGVGVYCRMDNAAYKVTVTNCNFYLSGSTALSGIDTYNGANKMGLEVLDCVFIGSSSLAHYGIRDRNTATSGTAAMTIRNNLFYYLRAGFNNLAATAPVDHITIENNTFVKCDGTANSYGSILIPNRTTPAVVIKDNLVVSSGVNDYDGLVAGTTIVTDWDADYNAFVNMVNSNVGYWASAQKSLANLAALPSASSNQLNDTLTPATLFATYGGTDYRNDYRLKAGVWALTAASDGSYVGAFGEQLPVVTVTANDNSATEAGPTTGQFTVSRGTHTNGALVVNFALSGSATPGGNPNDYTLSFSGSGAVDYSAKTGSVTIADGATNATITVTPYDDAEVESDQTVILTLSSLAGYTVGSPSSGTVTITSDDAGNLAPIVSAGSSQTNVVNTLPATNTLSGNATDDGVVNPAMTYLWSKQGGPGTVTFPGGDTVTNTTATFDAAGDYVLQLVAYDGALYATGTVSITILTNSAPSVSAGSDKSASLISTVNLDGTVTADDGLPTASGLTYLWTQDSGSGTATIGNNTNIDATATFDQLGTYTLKLTATDGLGLSGSDTVTITVRSNTEFSAIANGRFNAAATWDAPGGVAGPPVAGDTANIGGSNMVTTLSGNEISSQVTVNIQSTGKLQLQDPGATAISPIQSGATVNVASNGTLEIQAENNVVGTINLNGGILAYTGNTGNLAAGALLNINSNSFLTPIASALPKINCPVHGAGKLTLTADAGTINATIQFDAASTWSGAWDFQGNLRFSSGFFQRYIPGDERVASGKKVEYVSTTARTIKGTRSGFGTDTFAGAGTQTLGDGSGNGVLSPGDGASGVGTVTMSCYTTNLNHTFVFNSNSTYVVDITGTNSSESDKLMVVGLGSGTGKVDIVAGAILTVNLYTPQRRESLNAKIIDTVTGAGGEGLLTGNFSQINWVNANGWRNLAVNAVGNDLYVTGERSSSGSLLIVQ